MAKFSYVGQRYTQAGSDKTLLSFTADASDIRRWGGVPSKNERFHGGFQRALSMRYLKIINYFNDGQLSPGAIVVAFRQDAVSVTDLGYPSSWPKLEGIDTVPQFVHMEFECSDYDDEPLSSLIYKVRKLLESRPGFELMESSAQLDENDSLDADIKNVDDNDAESEGDDLDVGKSKLRSFYDFIGSEEAVKSWIENENGRIEALKQKKSLTLAEKEYVLYPADEKLKSTLISLLRPAMIVDGQHRVSGADESDKDGIRFTVCALKDADWVEQVFQFVVLNKMAKPISKDFLTELLNTSLTNKEVDEIDKRLEKIGIKNSDRRIHKYINYDTRSPFYGMVAEAGEVAGAETLGKLSQQGMLTLAKRWRSISAGGKTGEMNCFLKYLNASGLSEARDKWRDYETWISMFFAFWDEMKKLYEPQQIWEKAEKYHLLYIVTLQALQDVFLESKASGKVKFQSMEDFRAQVREFFAEVPSAFFIGWSQPGLQSGKGWELIKNAVKMFQDGMKLKKVKDSSPLFSQ